MTSSSRVRSSLARCGLAACFDHIQVEGEFGVGKPNPEVFVALARRLGAECSELFFVDDTLSYIEGARAAGVVAHQFAGADALERELAGHGLI